jgi:hypothetical protein
VTTDSGRNVCDRKASEAGWICGTA